jgi:hypothetical protein
MKIIFMVPAIEVGGFGAEYSKWLSVYLRRAELGEHRIDIQS